MRPRVVGPIVAVLTFVVASPVAFAMPTRSASCPTPDDLCVALTPASGPVGTHVTFTGHLPRELSPADLAIYRANLANSPIMGLERDVEERGRFCEILVSVDDAHAKISSTDVVSGSFVVGNEGACNQSDRSHGVTPGLYAFVLNCMSCQAGYFRVTTAPTGTLPFTGSAAALEMAAAAALIAAGVAMSVFGSRRTGGSRTATARRRRRPPRPRSEGAS